MIAETLKRIGVSGRRSPVSVQSSERDAIAGVNADLASLLSSKTINVAAWTAFQDALAGLLADPARERRFRMGETHWYNPALGLSDHALNAARTLIATGEIATATHLADLIRRTGARGQKGMGLLANLAVMNEEWDAATAYYALSNRKPSTEQWTYQEYRFAELRRYLQLLAVDWIDLSPFRSARARIVSLEDFVRGAISRGKLGDEKLRPILVYLGELKRKSPEAMRPPYAARVVRSMNYRQFRNYVDGKAVCLVANSQKLRDSKMGPVIDQYDVVIRFNSFVIEPSDTGVRTEVHVAVHLYEFNLDVPVYVRILLSGKQDLWEASIREKVRPDAQRWLGDSSLRWPARDLGLVGPKDPQRIPTAGFNMLRLLLHYDVSSRIDLVGFDFYKSGMLRLPDALTIEHSSAHQSHAEKEWILNRAKDVGDMIISMK